MHTLTLILALMAHHSYVPSPQHLDSAQLDPSKFSRLPSFGSLVRDYTRAQNNEMLDVKEGFVEGGGAGSCNLISREHTSRN